MTDRFHNLSVQELTDLEKALRAEHEATVAALKARMIAECPVKIGRAYRFREGHIKAGKMLVVVRLTVDRDLYNEHFWVFASGPLETKRSTAGDGFGRRQHYTRVENLDLATEMESPLAKVRGRHD